MAANGSEIYAGSWDGLYKSTDNGGNWSSVSDGITDTHITSIAFKGSYVFVGTSEGGVFRSSNNGNSWSAVNIGLSGIYYVNSLIVSGTNLYAGTWEGVFLSTNNGDSWTSLDNGSIDSYIHSLAINGSNIFAGTEDGVYLSADNGVNWNIVNTGLTNTFINSIAICGEDIFVGTAGGSVWKRSLANVLDVNEYSANSFFKLYPNPNRGKFRIEYADIPSVKSYIEIYNMNGVKVFTINNIRNTNATELDLSHFSKGVYLAKIYVNGKFHKEKFIIQ
jgi:hypothetical protein